MSSLTTKNRPRSRMVLATLKTLIESVFGGAGKTSVLPWIPGSVKLVLVLLLAFNASQLPLIWHFKVFYPFIRERIIARWKGPQKYFDDLKAGFTGVSPLDVRVVTHERAWPGDCDWNMHLSNSSYAKALDPVRMAANARFFTAVFPSGSWPGLGGSSYTFIKEIPIGAAYTVEARIGGWGEKWIYIIAEFITYPSKPPSRSRKPSPAPGESFVPRFSVPPSGVATPASDGVLADASSMDEVSRRAAASLGRVRADGGVVHCFAVTSYVSKLGRQSIPPRIVIAMSGYGSESNWQRSMKLLQTKDKGAKWLRGGWKEEADADSLGREWDNQGALAFSGLEQSRIALEQVRVDGVERFKQD